MLNKAPVPPADFDLPVTVRVSKRARRMALRLDSANRAVMLVIPERASLKKAWHFAREHEAWIRSKLSELPQPVPFVDGCVLPLSGRDRTIRIRIDPSRKTTDIQMEDAFLHVRTNREEPSARIERFLKGFAKDTLSCMAMEKAGAIGKAPSSIRIRDTKSRWGSCGPDGQLSFSWRLIFAPPAAMDYVVGHEIAHLVHMNHGVRFWRLCESLCLDYNSGKRWMRTHGHELLRYGLVL